MADFRNAFAMPTVARRDTVLPPLAAKRRSSESSPSLPTGETEPLARRGRRRECDGSNVDRGGGRREYRCRARSNGRGRLWQWRVGDELRDVVYGQLGDEEERPGVPLTNVVVLSVWR